MTVPTTLPRSPAGATVAANGTMSWGTMVTAPSEKLAMASQEKPGAAATASRLRVTAASITMMKPRRSTRSPRGTKNRSPSA